MTNSSKYKLIISYDGTNYCGWQVQKTQHSIAQAMQDTFADVFGSSIELIGASRTDAGVHAMGQVAVFSTDLGICPRSLLFGWNNKLPRDIRILDMQEVAIDFHPYRAKTQKTYWYHFFTQAPLPFVAQYGWHVHQALDLAKLQECLRVFVGTHDFKAFATLGDSDTKTTIRTIDSINLEYLPEWQAYRIIVVGPGFLQHMIRRIVGACIKAATQKQLSAHSLCDMLTNKDTRTVLATAPARGLMLYKVEYKETLCSNQSI
jgi:tRNA pseudouridine38-40 synthase